MRGPAAAFSEEQDKRIVQLRRAGFSFAEIASQIPGFHFRTILRRHAAIKAQSRAVWSAAPLPMHPNGTQESANAAAAKASQRLLKRQLATGQYSGAAREAWLVRHGDAA